MNQKKDIFNNNIKKELVSTIVFTLIFSLILFLGLGIAMLLLTLSYDNIEPDARIFLYFISGFSILCSIAYPLISFLLIRCYPKHKKLAHLFIKEMYFED